MNETERIRGLIFATGIAIGTGIAAGAALLRYVRHEIQRRGYPSWEECQCDFKSEATIFQVWHSRHEQRGETVVSHEWGVYLVQPARWLRHLLHTIAQMGAVLNPGGRYVERVTLSPQDAYLFAAILHARATNEDEEEEASNERYMIVWRREVLHYPNYFFDACIRRLYPAHVSTENKARAEALAVVWDPRTSLPLPTEGTLLDTPVGTRIDAIGWTPTQISYCTARLKNQVPAF